MDFQKRSSDIFLKHGTGATDLASVIIHLEDELDELRELVQLITTQEMSDSGRLFYPTKITSCRCLDSERIGKILEKYRETPHINQNED